MSSNSSGFRVRRHLSFVDVPCKGKVFYVDVKLPSLKQKLTKRIHDLGGQVEPFLSKDLDLILIDGDETKTSNINKLQNIPLSRGQALLNAAKDQKGDSDCNNNDIVHRATLLGVKTQTVKDFIQATSKCMSQLKAQKRAQQKEKDILHGMTPISWDKDKENQYILKVEDEEAIYRPLFKQFENTPKIAYNDTGSPFDVGVVLTKQEDGNLSKKKLPKAPVKGGYCESCDHWYKSTLKEHLKSDKHRAFVASIANFKSLEIATSGLPNLNSFMRKFDSGTCTSNVTQINTMDRKFNEEKPDFREKQFIDLNDDNKENIAVKDSIESPSDNTCKSKVKVQEVVNEKKLDCTGVAESVASWVCGYDRSQSQSNDSAHSKDNSKPSNNRKKLTLDAVLQDIFSDSNESNKQISKSTQDENIVADTVVKDPCSNVKNIETGANIPCDNPTNNAIVKGKSFIPEANFSSSSCSFGDNGVGNVLNFLQSNGSETSNRNLQAGRNSIETVLTERSHKSHESSLVKGSISSSQSAISNTLFSVQPNLDKFIQSDKGKSDTSTEIWFINNNTTNKISITDNINSDISKPVKKSSLMTVNPEYSNITEESISIEIPKVGGFEDMEVDKNNTPNKDVNDAIRDEMMKNVAKSGSTWSSIRNWLLPADNDNTPVTDDDNTPVNQTGRDLDKTLVHDETFNPKTDNGNEPIEENCDISNILNENLTNSSNNLVAAWIQNQEFEGKGGESEHSQHAFSNDNKTLCDNDKGVGDYPCNINAGESFKDAIATLMNPEIEDVKLTRDESVDSRTNDDDSVSDCTSISDCTLENFKVDPKEDNKSVVNSDKPESRDQGQKAMSWDCMSEKSGLSCHVTEKGIKIKGLSSINPHSERSDISSSEHSNQAHTDANRKDTSSFSSVAIGNLNNKDKLNSLNEISRIKAPIEYKCQNIVTNLENGVAKDPMPMISNNSNVEEINSSKLMVGQTSVSSNIPYLNSNSGINIQKSQSKEFLGSFNSPRYSSQTPNPNMNMMYSPISQTSQLNRSDYNRQQQLHNSNYLQGNPMSHGPFTHNHCKLENQSVNNSQTGISNYNDCQRIQDGYGGHGNKPGNPGTMYGDYFNTGILPMEAQYSVYGQEYGSCLSDFNQSFSNSSFYMNGTTDFLAMSSPRHSPMVAHPSHSRTNNYQNSGQNSNLGSNITFHHPSTTFAEMQKSSGNSNIGTSDFNSTSEVKPVKNKKGNAKGGKRKRNNSQLSFLSATSSFRASNESRLSSCGFSSSAVEPASNLQSSWYHSSPQSAVSSANFSTIRIEDIAERTGEYTYPFNQQTNNSVSQKINVKRKNAVSQAQNLQNVCHSPYSPTVQMNHSTPNSQPYIQPQSANVSVNNPMQNNHSYIYPNCTMDSGILNPNSLPNTLPYYNPAVNVSMPYSSPNTHIQTVSSVNPSQVIQKSVNSNLSHHFNPRHGVNVHSYKNSRTDFHVNPVPTETVLNTSGHVPYYQTTYSPIHKDTSQGYTGSYNAVQTGAMKLRLSKVPFSQPQPQHQQSDLKSYWNVRKAGECRLVFSNPAGKRKAAETPNHSDNALYNGCGQTDDHMAKRRKCLIY